MAAAASEEKLATPFGFDALKKAWEIYAQTAEIQESPMLSTIMSVCPYQLEDPFKVRVFLQNALQQAQLPKLLPGLGKHLRQTLRNDQIEITAEVRAMEAQAIAQTQKLYTDDDKLRYLEESYPALRQLRERLGLALM